MENKANAIDLDMYYLVQISEKILEFASNHMNLTLHFHLS